EDVKPRRKNCRAFLKRLVNTNTGSSGTSPTLRVLASRSLRNRWRPREYGRGLHDGSCRLSVNQKTIQHAIQRRDFRQMDLENEAIFAGDSMAFHNLGNLLSERRDFGKMSGKRPDSDERCDLMSRCFRIQFETIARNHPTFF